jgi:ABC-type lipoprotein release transport system permease subunit
MKDYQLAWKNLWRNRKRTLITAASVFFAVFLALIMRSFQLGTYQKLYSDVIESYSGYLQLQSSEFLDEPGLDNGFVVDESMIARLEADPEVTAVIPRLESFALTASGSRTQGVMVIGMDPEKEHDGLNMRNRMVKYKLTPGAVASLKTEVLPERSARLLDLLINESYTNEEKMLLDLGLSPGDSSAFMPLLRKHASFENSYLSSSDTASAIIGSGLSEYLQAGVGDTLVLMGQGFHGTSAAGLFVVKGIVRLPTPDIDNVFVYLPIEAARWFYAAPGMATSAIINIRNREDKVLFKTQERLNEAVGEELKVRNWRELNALLLNQMEADNKSGAIMLGILYLVIAFGVFGTVLMMLAERRREFGMLVSIGMQKHRLAKVVSLEMLMIGLLGVLAGVAASLPLVFYGNDRPLRFRGEMAKMYEDYGFEAVMPMLQPDSYYLWQVVIVLLIIAVAVAFSVRKILKLNIINALRA